MIRIEIPGLKTVEAEYLVLDYNGTLATDGALIPGVKERLNALSRMMTIHVITADTFGAARTNLEGTDCRCKVLEGADQRNQKLAFIQALGCEKVIAIGNGANDALMLEQAVIGIALIQREGASSGAVRNADVVCTDINDALDLLKHPLRIAATLRI